MFLTASQPRCVSMFVYRASTSIEKMYVRRNRKRTKDGNKIICILNIRWMFGGDRVEEGIDKFRHRTRFATAVRDDWSPRRNSSRDGPRGRGFMDFRQEIKLSLTWGIFTIKVSELFRCNKVFFKKCIKNGSNFLLCLQINRGGQRSIMFEVL